jgi:hypothetical protein
VIEVTPFVIAYYDQSRLIFDRSVPARQPNSGLSMSGYQ